MLAVADIGAAGGGVAAISIGTGHKIAVASLATVPLIVLLAKISGRYDHDETVLRKSTLDEAPALMMLAAAYALAWSFVAFVAGVHLDLGGAGVVALWAHDRSSLLVVGRAGARALGQRSAPLERVLIIGASVARARLAQSFACDPGAHIEVVGWPAARGRAAGRRRLRDPAVAAGGRRASKTSTRWCASSRSTGCS